MSSALLPNGSSVAEMKNRIDAKINELQKLENQVIPNLKVERQNLFKKSSQMDDIEVSLKHERKLLLEAMNTLDSDIDATRKSDLQMREKLTQVELAIEKYQKQRVEDLILYEKGLDKMLPRFRDALKIYSDDNLKNEIEEIKKEREMCNNEIATVNQEIENLISKYNLDELDSTARSSAEDVVMKDVVQLNAIWKSSNSEIALARKKREKSIQELEAKVATNERRIKNLSV